MLLANGKACRRITNNGGINSVTMKDMDGVDVTYNPAYFSTFCSSLQLYVGTGKDEPTVNDYSITDIDAGLTTVIYTGTNNTANASYTENYIGVFTKTYRNDTDEDVTVSEVAIMGYGEYPGNIRRKAIIARDVISPVTIKPGEAYTFTMYIG
jgi:hypothetical protein